MCIRLFSFLVIFIFTPSFSYASALPVYADPYSVDDVRPLPGGGYTGNVDHKLPPANDGSPRPNVRLPRTIPPSGVARAARALGRGGIWGLYMIAFGWLWDEATNWWYRNKQTGQWGISASGPFWSSATGACTYAVFYGTIPGVKITVTSLGAKSAMCSYVWGTSNQTAATQVNNYPVIQRVEPTEDEVNDVFTQMPDTQKSSALTSVTNGQTQVVPGVFQPLDLANDPAIIQARKDVAEGKIPSPPYDKSVPEIETINTELGDTDSATTAPDVNNQPGQDSQQKPEQTSEPNTGVTGAIFIPGLPKLPYVPSFQSSAQRLFTAFTGDKSLQARIKNIAFPTGGSCPTSNINVLGASFDLFSGACNIYDSVSGIFTAVMIPVWAFLAFRIVGSA